jgi:hypothetical protein
LINVAYENQDDELDFTLITYDDTQDRLCHNTNLVSSSMPYIRMITLLSRNSYVDQDNYEEIIQELSDKKWIKDNLTTNPVVIDFIYFKEFQVADIPDEIKSDLKSIASVQEIEFDAIYYFNY